MLHNSIDCAAVISENSINPALVNKNILVIGTESWFGPLLSKHRIVLELCKYNRVIYMEPPYHLGKLLRGISPNDSYLVAAPYHQEYPNTFSRFVPIWLPKSYYSRIIRSMSESILYLQLYLNAIKPDIIISFSLSFPFLTKNKSKFIFYAVDTHGADKNSDALEVRLETETLAKADLVVAGTEKLYAEFQGRTKHLKLLTHGVDVDAIIAGVNSSIPDDLHAIPKPLIGFLGAVNQRLDISLIEYLAHIHPEWSLVFVGPYQESDFGSGLPKEQLERLKSLSNLYLLGRRPSSLVGAYFNAFDVCIMPYDVSNPYVHFASHKPLQSLAVGTPVVTTCAASDTILPPSVRVGETPTAFVQAIEKTLVEHNELDAEKARAFVKGHSWKHRVYQLSEWIAEIMN